MHVRTLALVASSLVVTACDAPPPVAVNEPASQRYTVVAKQRSLSATGEVLSQQVTRNTFTAERGIDGVWKWTDESPIGRITPSFSGSGLTHPVRPGPTQLAVPVGSPLAGYAVDVVYPLNDSAGGTAVWTTIAGGPLTDVVQLDSGRVRTATKLRWQLQEGQWVGTGWRIRTHEDDGTITDLDVTYSPDGNVTAAPNRAPFRVAAACASAATAGFHVLLDAILPAQLNAQTIGDCWRYKRIGVSAAYSFQASTSPCWNYGVSSTLEWFNPDPYEITALITGLVTNAMAQEPVPNARNILRGRISAAARPAVRVATATTGGVLAGLFAVSVAVNMNACINNPVTVAERNACVGGSSSTNPYPHPQLGSMGNALGFSSGALRGQVNQFWGVSNTN